MERKTPFLFLLSNDFSFLVAFLHAQTNDLIDPHVIYVIYVFLFSAALWSILNCFRVLLRHAIYLFIIISSHFDLSCLFYLILAFYLFLSCCHSRGNTASTYARLASTFSSVCAKRNDGPQATIKILMFYFFLFCRLSQSTKLHPRVLIISIAKTQRGKFSRVSSLLACTPTRCMP